MDFHQIKTAVQRQFKKMSASPLYDAKVDGMKLWELFLASFPEGTNPIFRTRTEHDCSCCRSFIKNIGGLVSIKDGELVSIWDCSAGEYQPVVDALGAFVKTHAIDNVFLRTEARVGTDKNIELDKESGKSVRTWEHFSVTLPAEFVVKGVDIGPKTGEHRANHDVLLRSLKEITDASLETVLDLIAQNSLYRGAEKEALVKAFAKLKKSFNKLKTDTERDLFVWEAIRGPSVFVSRMRNDVIGTLLSDLSEGFDLEDAVASFENKVSGTNYKRPTALITPKMRDAAKAKIAELGLLPALERRYAVLEDIKVTDVIFANRDAKKRMTGDVFDDLPTKTVLPKNLDKVEEIAVEDFIAKVVPTAKSIEVLFEGRHSSNLVSLTAPADLTAPSLFKWENPFAWAYNGDVADSIKERVKAAGGRVEGDVCCRLAWHNTDDLDFHMNEPGNYEIMFGNKRQKSPNGGILDVDANGSDGQRPDPCENIVYADHKKMKFGTYTLAVNQFSQREMKDVGFDVELEVMGAVHRFSHPEVLRNRVRVDVAQLQVSADGIKVVPLLPSSTSAAAGKQVWGVKTQEFQPVQAFLLSPNHWGEHGTGNKHFFFMLGGCKNEGEPRGFFNEFLKSELEPHRKTMEIVGSKMRAEKADEQLSGLGFSSTQRNYVLCRVGGTFTRTLKVLF